MTKAKRMGYAIVAIVLSLTLALGILGTVKHYLGIADTGLKDTLTDGLGKEATVIFLAGQSNAAGCSRDEYLKKTVSPEKYAEYERGYDNVYINYFASGTNQSDGFVKCAARQGEFGKFFGPELGLAEWLNENHPDKIFFIIKYAWGGTNLYEQWLSPTSGTEGPLYHSFVEYAKTSIRYLSQKNYRVNIEAMCWMQGEADSMDASTTAAYADNLSNFIHDIRGEFSNHASGDGIAFVDAYIADSFFWTHYAALNEAKQAVADASPSNVAIDTIAHGLSVTGEPEGEPDIAHYDSLSELKLGHLFAEALSSFFDK